MSAKHGLSLLEVVEHPLGKYLRVKAEFSSRVNPFYRFPLRKRKAKRR